MQQPHRQLTLFQAGFKKDGVPMAPPPPPPPTLVSTGRGSATGRPSTGRGSATGRPSTGRGSATVRPSTGRGSATVRPSTGRGSTAPQPSGSDDVILIEDDDDDLLLVQALEESMRDEAAAPSPAAPSGTALETLPGFDVPAGGSWVYPVNYPTRQYQLDMVQTALYHNTLVCLPTGLGKTFIAAVLMYNFYRWYPRGKVVFMAPTRPLVAQQINACYRVMGISREDTAEVTGSMSPANRRGVWMSRRVFFLTPQVLSNDLITGSCPAELLRCVVVDEAHKALGNHAYCQVVRELLRHNTRFRVLALSATPGSDLKAVLQVISNLLISRVEARSEDCADITPYTHERRLEKVVVRLGEQLTSIRREYMQVVSVFVSRLIRQKVIYTRDEMTLTKYQLLKARCAFKESPPPGIGGRQAAMVDSDFVMCMSLYHALELLQLHGLRSFHTFLQSVVAGERGSYAGRAELARNADFRRLLTTLGDTFGSQPVGGNTGAQCATAVPPSVPAVPPGAPGAPGASAAQPDTAGHVQGRSAAVLSHPKLEKLRNLIQEHFRDSASCGEATRVMVFSQYRESVLEISDLLQQLQPQVKAMHFIGQNAGKSSKGLSQKEQLKVIAAFRDGGYNTLISTCVGEEGLDIGDVDLIVCFDVSKSPISLVQRMGRTGRRRRGRIVVLVTEGKEEQAYSQSMYQKQFILKTIMAGVKLQPHLYRNSPRMVPRGLHPVCQRLHMLVPPEPVAAAAAAGGRGRGRAGGATGGKRGRAGGATGGRGRLPSLLACLAPERSPAAGAYLTEAELLDWDRRFKLRAGDGSARRLRRRSSDGAQPAKPGATIALHEWLPWQTTLQPTYQVSHSAVSRTLVRVLGFMTNQAQTDSDIYDRQMKSLLRPEDVEEPSAAVPATAVVRLPSPRPSPPSISLAELSTLSESEQVTEAIRRSLLEPVQEQEQEQEQEWAAVRPAPAAFSGWGDAGLLLAALQEALAGPALSGREGRLLLAGDCRGQRFPDEEEHPLLKSADCDGERNCIAPPAELTAPEDVGAQSAEEEVGAQSVPWEVGAQSAVQKVGEAGDELDIWCGSSVVNDLWPEDPPSSPPSPEDVARLPGSGGHHATETARLVLSQRGVTGGADQGTDRRAASTVQPAAPAPAHAPARRPACVTSEDDGSPILPSQRPTKRRKLSHRRSARLFEGVSSPEVSRSPGPAPVLAKPERRQEMELEPPQPQGLPPQLVRPPSSEDMFADDSLFVDLEEPPYSLGFTTTAPAAVDLPEGRSDVTGRVSGPVGSCAGDGNVLSGERQEERAEQGGDDQALFGEPTVDGQKLLEEGQAESDVGHRRISCRPVFNFSLGDDELFVDLVTPSSAEDVAVGSRLASAPILLAETERRCGPGSYVSRAPCRQSTAAAAAAELEAPGVSASRPPGATSILGTTQLLALVDQSSIASPGGGVISAAAEAASDAALVRSADGPTAAAASLAPARPGADLAAESAQPRPEKPVFDLFSSFFEDSLALDEALDGAEEVHVAAAAAGSPAGAARLTKVAVRVDSDAEPDVSPILASQPRPCGGHRRHSTPLTRPDPDRTPPPRTSPARAPLSPTGLLRTPVSRADPQPLRHSTPLARPGAPGGLVSRLGRRWPGAPCDVTPAAAGGAGRLREAPTWPSGEHSPALSGAVMVGRCDGLPRRSDGAPQTPPMSDTRSPVRRPDTDSPCVRWTRRGGRPRPGRLSDSDDEAGEPGRPPDSDEVGEPARSPDSDEVGERGSLPDGWLRCSSADAADFTDSPDGRRSAGARRVKIARDLDRPSESTSDRSSSSVSVRVPRKKKRCKNPFVDDEADLSASRAASSDESSGDNDPDVMSMIDDGPDPTQAGVDMQAVYMRSVRSPAGGGRSPVRRTRPRVPDALVFSQAVRPDDDDYEQDSFCVGSDHVEYATDSSHSDHHPEDPQPQPQRRRRRIVQRMSSSEDEQLLPSAGGAAVRCDTSAAVRRQSESDSEADFQPDGSEVRAAVALSAAVAGPAEQPLAAPANGHQTAVRPLVVVVSCREVGSAPQVLSDLRSLHGVTMDVRTLPAEDYVVSCRCAVIRRPWADINSAAGRRKLVHRLKLASRLHEVCWLLTENDRVRPGRPPSAATRPRATDRLLADLTRAGVRLLHSQSAAETARLLTRLATSERLAGYGLPPPRELQPLEQARRRLLAALPCLSVATADRARREFAALADLFSCAPSETARRLGGLLSRPRAVELWHALRRRLC